MKIQRHEEFAKAARKHPVYMDFALRPATTGDRKFVESVYFESHRWLIERLFGWRGDAVERARFAQHYNEARTAIVVIEGEAAGWLSVDRRPGAITVEQIYIAATWRNRGVGTQLLSGLIAEAAGADIPLRLSTAKINPAVRLYERLGFRATSESEHKVFLERSPREC
ncbi:MAG TPA: GNAT family N-acetyltransferase [Candidatus Cybelea sp.]|nr:GNAT family N-acetyltransferase [Candidatus Cybelea sp.]